jgi:hypothetical protein
MFYCLKIPCGAATAIGHSYMKTLPVPDRKHYVSATEPKRLMLFVVGTVRNTQIHCVWGGSGIFSFHSVLKG